MAAANTRDKTAAISKSNNAPMAKVNP